MTSFALNRYDKYIVMFSGGKDSLACVLHLLELGVEKERIELWHHDVDGREGSTLMDWPCTRNYVAACAAELGIPLYCSWKVGGFEREMLRDGTSTAAICFESPRTATEPACAPIRVRTSGGNSPKVGTRKRFPQVAADLRVRWCSAYLKIDVAAAALRGQERFDRQHTLVITGERADESSARAKYKDFEPHRADRRDGRSRRHIDHWRPVHAWSEAQVWEIIERHRMRPHPAYRLGWGRVSCAACIFGSPAQWASLRKIAPAQFDKIASYEDAFGSTIQRKRSVRHLAVLGTPYRATEDLELAKVAMDHNYSEAVRLAADETWSVPAGAYGDACGPT